MLYNNFAPDCMWKTMGFDELTWRANYNGKFLHWLFNLPGVCHYMLEPDELHVIHLGCMQYCIGSVLWLLCYIIMLDEPESNMHACWLIICEYYRTFGSKCQYTNLGLESFLKDKKQPKKHFPCLKGKGAECRDLLPAVHSVWLQCAKRYHDYELIEAMLKSMVVVQDHLHDHASDMFLPLDVCRDIMKHVDNFLVKYQECAFKAQEAGDLLFNNPTKFHWLWHWSRRVSYLNPRQTNCYLDEDYVGKLKILLASCSAGSDIVLITTKALEKYRWALHFACIVCKA